MSDIHPHIVESVINILRETGHDAACVGALGFELLQQYARNMIVHTEGDHVALVQMTSELHRLFGELIDETYKYFASLTDQELLELRRYRDSLLQQQQETPE